MYSRSFRLGPAAFACAAIVSIHSAAAQIPQMISYQGRVAVNGVNHHGAGQFKFALVRGDYSGGPTEPFALWTNDGSGVGTNPNAVPTGSVNLTCDKGLYSVLLGNTAASMVAIPPTVFTNADVRLRVWFNDGSHGFQLLTPDQRMVSTGYAMIAESAMSVPDGSIGTAKLATGAVGSNQLASGAVTSTKLGDGSVTTGKLGAVAVSSDKIAVGAVGSAQIADGSVAYADLALNSVKTGEIVDGEVRTADLADSAVTSAKIQNGTITAMDIAFKTITNQEIVDGTIVASNIAGDTITGQEIANGSVASADITDNSVASVDIANGTIQAVDLADSAVTNAKLATNAVTGDKIQPSAITASHVAVNTLTASEIATNAVGSAEILDGDVRTVDLANGAVTTPKLATVPAVKLTISSSIQVVAAGNGSGSITIPWDVEEFDTANMHNPATPAVILAPVKGIYRLTVWLDESTGVGRNASTRVYKNGAVVPNYLHIFASTEEQHYGGSIDLALNAGEYLTLETVLSRTNDFVYPMSLSVFNKSTHCSLVFVTPLP